MNPNPLLKKLGLPMDAKVVILHADDIGMCQATINAFEDLIDFGLVSSGSVMVPCPWFPAAAKLFQKKPEMDLGVHLTLNSEWDGYRWRPISTCDLASGLIDADRYFHHRQPPVQNSADPQAVEVEIAAQVARAKSAGIDVTHVDTHMFTLTHPRLIGAYLRVAAANHVPPMLVRMEESGYRAMGMDSEAAAFSARMVTQLEAQGLPLLDGLLYLPAEQPQNRVELAKAVLSRVPLGVTHFFIHPAQDTPELRAIARDWPSRVADYQAFTDEGLRKWVKESGLVIIGYREIRNATQA